MWLQRYGATAVCRYVTELQQCVVTLWSYSSWLLRYGVTATCDYTTELQQLVVRLRSYSSLWLRIGATEVCGYNISELQHIVGDGWMQHIQEGEFNVKSQFYSLLALRIQIRWTSSYGDFMQFTSGVRYIVTYGPVLRQYMFGWVKMFLGKHTRSLNLSIPASVQCIDI